MTLLAMLASSYWTIYPAQLPKSERQEDILVYGTCTQRNVALLDDGRANPEVVAKAVADKCAVAYRKWLAVVTAGGKSQGVLSNYDMALFDVEMARRKRPRNANQGN